MATTSSGRRSAVRPAGGASLRAAGSADGHFDADADGYELARRLSAISEVGRQVVYIAVTGFGQPNDFQRSAEAVFAHHLVKPVDPNELDQIPKELLPGRGADDGGVAPAT